MHTESTEGQPVAGIRRRVGAPAPRGRHDEGQEKAIDPAEGKSINTRTLFGRVQVIDPGLVVKLAMVVDNYKIPNAWRMWPEVEQMAKEQLAHLSFDPSTDLFFSEQVPFEGHAMTNLFRYYTPISNRMPRDRSAPL